MIKAATDDGGDADGGSGSNSGDDDDDTRFTSNNENSIAKANFVRFYGVNNVSFDGIVNHLDTPANG